MNLNDYQSQLRSLTQSIQVKGDPFEFNCIGLAEEAGEVMSKLKRALRGEGFNRKGYLLELGDVLGYLALAAGAKDLSMQEVHDLVSSWTWVPDEYMNLKVIIKVSKVLYDSANQLLNDPTNYYDRTRIKWLLSIVLRTIDSCAIACDSTLEELMQLNLQKLKGRLQRNGHLLGTGMGAKNERE